MEGKALYVMAGYDEFMPFEGKVTTLHLYEFWPTRHILSVQLKELIRK